MTKYIVYIKSGVPTLHEVEVVDMPGMTPIVGCDILIKNEHGHINSARSARYSDSAADAIAAALESEQGSRTLWQSKASDAAIAIAALKLMQERRES